MTSFVAALFVMGLMVAVPLGLRLVPPLEVGHTDRVLRGMRRLALPTAVALGLAFLRSAGWAAAALAIPWLIAAGLGTLAAGGAAIGAVRDGWPVRPQSEHAVRAALAFLPITGANRWPTALACSRSASPRRSRS